MKVLVTGATGFLGKYLLPALAKKGHSIVVLTRNEESAGFRLPVLCETRRWLPCSEEPALPEGVQAVVHLAGAGIGDRRWSLARKHEIIRSRVHSTRNLVKAMKESSAKPGVFISASGVGIYGETGDMEADETSPSRSGFLADVCREWEKEIFEAEGLGIRTAAIRFGFILGRDGVAMDRILPPFRMGLGGPLGGGRQWMSWIHARDAAGIILHALENQNAKGIYNAVAPNPATNAEFAKTLGKVLSKPAAVPVPGFVLRLGLGKMSELVLSSQKVSCRKIMDAGYRFHYETLEPALRDICDPPHRGFETEQWVPRPIEETFGFFRDPRNLEALIPPFLNFRIIGRLPEEMKNGVRLNYRLSLRGVPVRWQSRILDWNPPHGFSDAQTKGPYGYWKHSHEFYEKDGGTVIRDRVAYSLPFGPPADVVAGSFVRNDLEEIFTWRRKAIGEILGSPDDAEQEKEPTGDEGKQPQD